MTSNPSHAVVVDASVAVKWHLTDEEDAETAADVLSRFGRNELAIFAPEQIRYEVASAITVATLGRTPRLTHEDGRAAIEEFLSLDLQCVSDQDLILAAYPLVHQYGCAFYDAVYLALAQRLRVSLLVADRKFYQRTGHLPEVVWIGDVDPARRNAGR